MVDFVDFVMDDDVEVGEFVFGLFDGEECGVVLWCVFVELMFVVCVEGWWLCLVVLFDFWLEVFVFLYLVVCIEVSFDFVIVGIFILVFICCFLWLVFVVVISVIVVCLLLFVMVCFEVFVLVL